MKNLLKRSSDPQVKKHGTAVIVAILLLILASGTVAACQTAAGASTASPSAAPSPLPSATGAPSVNEKPASASPANPDEDKALELAKAWAEAVKNRDGKAQYEFYTSALQKKVYSAYEALNWVTGTSSPWVESYSIEFLTGGATVTFKYATSTGPAGEYDVLLIFAEEGNKLKIREITNAELILGDEYELT